jgi:hypothetical protein
MFICVLTSCAIKKSIVYGEQGHENFESDSLDDFGQAIFFKNVEKVNLLYKVATLHLLPIATGSKLSWPVVLESRVV